jgi:hypothetical protein
MEITAINHAEHLLQRLGNAPVLPQPQDAQEVLSGTEMICRPLNAIVRADIEPGDWYGLETDDRDAIYGAYRELGKRAEPLFISAGFHDPGFVFPSMTGELLSMATQSAAAQFIATCLASRFDEFRDRLQPYQVTDLALSSLKTLVAWRRGADIIDANRAGERDDSFMAGLDTIADVYSQYS